MSPCVTLGTERNQDSPEDRCGPSTPFKPAVSRDRDIPLEVRVAELAKLVAEVKGRLEPAASAATLKGGVPPAAHRVATFPVEGLNMP